MDVPKNFVRPCVLRLVLAPLWGRDKTADHDKENDGDCSGDDDDEADENESDTDGSGGGDEFS